MTLDPGTEGFAMDGQVAAATAAPTAIGGFARKRAEFLSRPAIERDVVDSCSRAFSLLAQGAEGGTIAVVSAWRGEGRTTVAAALGTAIARDTDSQCLVVDLDFERPAQAHLFSISATPGLTEHVEQRHLLRLVAGWPEGRLWLAPAGARSRHPARVYNRILELGLIAAFRRRFPWVVLDLPSLLDNAEGVRLAHEADHHLVIGRQRHTPVAAVEKVLRLLGPGARAGFLLTDDKSRVPGWLRRLV